MTDPDACHTAIAMAAELDRLVPGGHRRTRDVVLAGDFLPERPRHLGLLVELRCLLPAGPVPTVVLAGLFRYETGMDEAVADLVAEGWLVRSANAVAATPRCSAVLTGLRAAITVAVDDAWGTPHEQLARVDAVVRGAIGTSEGPVFGALATVAPDGSPAARLFERCNALRHHRADAHAAAWQAAGLTASSVAELPGTDPVRQDVETATNRVASRPYLPLSTVDRAELVALLGRLPG